jgi:hypothetical protein
MRVSLVRILALACLLLCACRNSSLNSTAKLDSNANDAAILVEREIANLPPFATKEPEKYSAKIVLAFKSAESENFIEQNYYVARDGANRRLDFELGKHQISDLQTIDGKHFIMLPKQKIYAEFAQSSIITNLPEDISLGHLLHTKPIGASYQKIGEEEIGGRKATKYKLDFGTVPEDANMRTETFVWADETLGLPIKTEIVGIENTAPNGAKSIIELREINNQPDAQIFTVPKDFRKVSFDEIQQIIRR